MDFINRLEHALFKQNTMEEQNNEQTIIPQNAEQPAGFPLESTPQESPKQPVTPQVEAETPDEPQVEVPTPDRSDYNCADCKGEGLKDQYTVCPSCNGTGKR